MVREGNFDPGFRFLGRDKFVLAGAGILAPLFYFAGGATLGFTFLVVILQFFLFCNVFRVQTRRELVWVALAGGGAVWGILNEVDWYSIVGWMMGLGVLVIFWETKDRLYHGVFWKRINPDLKKRWHETKGGGLKEGEE